MSAVGGRPDVARRWSELLLLAKRRSYNPEKTFIGRVEKGFDFPGYHFGPDGLSVTKKTIENFVARAIRFYEQEPWAASNRPLPAWIVRAAVGWMDRSRLPPPDARPTGTAELTECHRTYHRGHPGPTASKPPKSATVPTKKANSPKTNTRTKMTQNAAEISIKKLCRTQRPKGRRPAALHCRNTPTPQRPISDNKTRILKTFETRTITPPPINIVA